MDRASWELREGDELAAGRHAVRLLGGGNRYEAYLAWDDRLRALVVVKALRPDSSSDPEALGMLEAEAALLRRLAHPMLPRLYGAATVGERPQLVLEHLEGPRLSTLLRRFGVTIEQLLPLAINVCSVLHYLGHERVVHLDVKPSNLIMGGEPRLIDLSVARTFDQLGSIGRPVGTDAYMSPEQRDPARFGEIGPASDVWGLGATLYEGMAARPPGPSPERPRGRFPEALADAVMACLSPRPAERPTAARLADELEPIAASLPAPKIGRFRPGGGRLLRELSAR